MIGRFNLYDFLANLIPGVFFLWVLEQMSRLAGWTLPFPVTGQLAETSVLVALGYLTGLLLQALSERVEKWILKPLWGGFPSDRWLLPDDTRFSASYKEQLKKRIAERFGVAVETIIPEGATAEQRRELMLKKNNELFYLCYNAVEKLSDRPLIFNSHYGLCRCLLTVFGLLSVLSLVLVTSKWTSLPDKRSVMIWLLVIFALLGLLSYGRTKQRSEDFARSIFDIFLSNSKSG